MSGEASFLAATSEDEHPSAQKVIEELEHSFVHGAKSGKYKATGMASMVTIKNSDTGEKEDALCVNLDHKDNYSVKITFPYKITKKLFGKSIVEIFSPTAMKGDGKIFE